MAGKEGCNRCFRLAGNPDSARFHNLVFRYFVLCSTSWSVEVDDVADGDFVDVKEWTQMTRSVPSNDGVASAAGKSSVGPQTKTFRQRFIANAHM